MPGLQTFTTDATLDTLRNEWLYTMARLLKNPHTAAFLPAFQAVGPVLEGALATQRTLEDASVVASAGRDAADDALDPLMMQVIHALLVVTHDNRDDPLFLSYTGSRTPAEIIRPVLGSELVLAAEWIEPLQEEDDPSLQALGRPIECAVTAGQAAEKDVKSTQKALTDFRLIGERKKAVDALNAARGGLYGSLLEFQHQNPQLRLPAGWAMEFFLHQVKGVKYGATVAQVEEFLASQAAITAAAREHLALLQQKAAAYDDAKAKRAQARLDLAALRQAEREQKKQAKALKAEAERKLKRT